jgi:hypothetical protein
VEDELKRFEEAVEISQRQIREAVSTLESQNVAREHVLILEAHLLMLKDPAIVDRVRSLIRSECINADWAVKMAIQEIEKAMETIDDELPAKQGGGCVVRGRAPHEKPDGQEDERLPSHRRQHNSGPRPVAGGHGHAQQGPWCWASHRCRRDDLAHGDHSPFPGDPGGCRTRRRHPRW